MNSSVVKNGRAYIDFKDTDSLIECYAKLEKHSFLDRRGLTGYLNLLFKMKYINDFLGHKVSLYFQKSNIPHINNI